MKQQKDKSNCFWIPWWSRLYTVKKWLFYSLNDIHCWKIEKLTTLISLQRVNMYIYSMPNFRYDGLLSTFSEKNSTHTWRYAVEAMLRISALLHTCTCILGNTQHSGPLIAQLHDFSPGERFMYRLSRPRRLCVCIYYCRVLTRSGFDILHSKNFPAR
jgi:hypothetical protein